MKKLLLLICGSLLSMAPFIDAAAQNYVINGGFEFGLEANWTHAKLPGTAATFTLNAPSQAKEGNVELMIDLDNGGSSKYGVRSTTTALVASDSIYLLRFWARESKTFVYDDKDPNYVANPDFAEMIVTIEGESGNKHEVSYRFRQGMTLFHLPFKTFDKNLAISFYPQTNGRTYYIDGVELIDQSNDRNIDVWYTYVWNNMQSSTDIAWVAGDNDVSIPLPDGRILWVFNDSFEAKSGGSHQSSNDTTTNILKNIGSFVRNAAVVQEKDGTLINLGSSDVNNNGQRAYFETVEEIVNANGNQTNFYWVGNGIMEDGKVKIYLVEIDEQGGIHSTGRSYIAEMSFPELELLDIKRQTDFCYRYETLFVDNDTIYLYKNGGESTTVVARTPLGNFIGAEMWEFWNGEAWVKDPSQAVPVLDTNPESVTKLGEGSYAHLSGLGALSSEIKVAFAPAPQGPWTERQTVYRKPNDWQYWAYMPNFHGQLENGNFLISYSTNAWLPLFFSTWSFADKYWYRPRYIQVDLLSLSPYSESPVRGKAILYSDCGYAGKAIGLNAGSYKLSDLLDKGFADNALSSIKLEDGYVIELFDGDNFQGASVKISGDIACLDLETFDDRATSVIVRRAGVENLSGTFVLQNKATGLVLGASEPGGDSKINLVQTGFTNDPSQHFQFNYKGNGFYTIVNAGVGQLVGALKNSVAEGAEIVISDDSEIDITDLLGGAITAQYYDSPSREEIDKLIDNNPATKYLTFHSKGWTQYEAPDPYVVKSYSITSANDAPERDPKNWTLSGSNDGVTWTVIHEVSGHSFSARFQKMTFSFENSTAYTHYRLDMESSANLLQLAEWELFYQSENAGETWGQQFILHDAGNGYYKIYNRNSDMPLDALGSYLPGGLIRQIQDIGQKSALWTLISADTVASAAVDCAGVINGEAMDDRCNFCYGGKTGKLPCALAYDCNGDFLGDAYLDDCDECVGGNTGQEPCTPLGLDENALSGQSILYPNPVANALTLKLGDQWRGQPIVIFNMQGVKVWWGTYQSKEIDLSHLPGGVYLLKITNGRDAIGVKFIKD